MAMRRRRRRLAACEVGTYGRGRCELKLPRQHERRDDNHEASLETMAGVAMKGQIQVRRSDNAVLGEGEHEAKLNTM